jgi:hypothetical protein
MLTLGPMVPAALTPAASVIVWGLVLLAVMVVVTVGLEVARRRWWTPSAGREGSGSGFSIERLEAVHRAGQITDEEFDRLRRQILGLPPAGNPPPSASSPPGHSDDGNAGASA